MPASNKTTYLGLNQFIGSDMPKMADFNEDNRLLDSRFQEHEEDTNRHLTAAAVAALNKADFVVGSYVGSGVDDTVIDLGCEPAFGILFAVGQPLRYFDVNNMTNFIYGGYFGSQGAEEGLSLSGSKLTVRQYEVAGVDGRTYFHNQSGVTYFYICWKA